MSDTNKRIAEIRERLEKATPGPWGVNNGQWEVAKCGRGRDGTEFWVNGNGYAVREGMGAEPQEDANFIANAPSDITFLLEQVEKSSGWVEITDDPETLPEESGYYMITIRAGERQFVYQSFYWKPSREFQREGTGLRFEATHWSPLPVPPHRDHLE